jgi:hypothetical protein
MEHKGQYVHPVQPFHEALDHAMEAIDSCESGAAVFMVAGHVMCTKRTSLSFENNVDRLASGLIGVYDGGADYRCVREDLMEFYSRMPVPRYESGLNETANRRM